MKELSMEEKARRYDDLLVKLQEAKVDDNVCDERYCCVIDDIVPELKESEDEKIRKELIEHIKANKEADYVLFKKFSPDDVIDLLEKQAEVESDNDDIEAEEEDIRKALNKIWDEKKGEYKSSWSGEDEAYMTYILVRLKQHICNENFIECNNWFKSLKDRVKSQNHWKPSDGQMKALHDLNLTGNISYAGQGQVLIELYNDLKKF